MRGLLGVLGLGWGWWQSVEGAGAWLSDGGWMGVREMREMLREEREKEEEREYKLLNVTSVFNYHIFY